MSRVALLALQGNQQEAAAKKVLLTMDLVLFLGTLRISLPPHPHLPPHPRPRPRPRLRPSHPTTQQNHKPQISGKGIMSRLGSRFLKARVVRFLTMMMRGKDRFVMTASPMASSHLRRES